MAEETRYRYSDEELQEFKEIILEKLAKANKDYEMLKSNVMNSDGNDVADTAPTFKVLEEGANTLSKEEAGRLAQQKYNVAIRVGVNGGSLDEDIKKEFPNDKESSLIVKSALKYTKILEDLDFKNIVISLKSTNVFTTIEAYREFSKISDYPLHIGLTESGFDEIGIIRSCAALSPFLLEGIGNTIRISLTSDPYKEVKTCKRLLHDLNLYDNYPTLISCPTCGRCKVNPKPLAIKTLKFLEDNNINLKVAIMGCVVNGIGEGKSADIGLAGGDKSYIIFKNGEILKTVQEENALDELFNEILKMSKEKK